MGELRRMKKAIREGFGFCVLSLVFAQVFNYYCHEFVG